MRWHPDWLVPDWQVPADVGGLMTTRQGGVSAAPFDSMNIRPGLGDDASAVQRNQQRLARSIAATPVYLNQVHGSHVVRLTRADAAAGAAVHTADASITTECGIACTAQVADCLPLLFAGPAAVGAAGAVGAVGAAHAGWRGLASGVVEATLAALCEAAACSPGDVRVWLGACIGPRQFEVGPDVLAAFGADPAKPDPARFTPRVQAGAPKWSANLAQLARDRLQAAGVVHMSAADACTVEDASRFFSYRRDGVTGRMVAVVWRRG